MNTFQKLLDFLNRLDETSLTYTLEHNREDAIMVCVSRDNEYWEVEYLADGDVDIEIFYSDEENGLEDEDALERLFEDISDEDETLEENEEGFEDQETLED